MTTKTETSVTARSKTEAGIRAADLYPSTLGWTVKSIGRGTRIPASSDYRNYTVVVVRDSEWTR